MSSGKDLVPFPATASRRPELYRGLNHLFSILIDPKAELLRKHSAVVIFMTAAQRALGGATPRQDPPPPNLARAAFPAPDETSSSRLAENGTL